LILFKWLKMVLEIFRVFVFKMKFKLKTHHELDLARLVNDQIFYRNEKKNRYQKPTCF